MTKPKELSTATTKIILESISDGVFTVDHEWRITSFNRAAEQITGVTREDALGQYCWDVFRANMCKGDCALKKTMRKRKAFVNSSTCIINQNGDSIPISVSTSLLKDANGKILGGVETFRDKSQVEELRKELAGHSQFSGMFSRSREMQHIFSIMEKVAESDSTVLIEGETGTGKELLSRAIHNHSGRKNKKFVAINCGALPDTLLESELFGYKAGAFTGANRDKPGLFASAGNGTILLDEIGDTSPAFQVKLLRLLEEHEFQPLGSVHTVKTEARILAATNKNLSDMIDAGAFRKDLYYRINIVHLKLPPLRKRTEDIPLLTETFIKKMNGAKNREIINISAEAMALLMSHTYPGNIRELENIIEHAFVLCRDTTIDTIHLPAYLSSGKTYSPSAAAGKPATLQKSVDSTEKHIIIETLKSCGYNRNATARKLGMNKSTLYRKIRKLDITLPELDGRFKILTKE